MDPQEQYPAYDPKQKVGNELHVLQPGEKIICEIKRHPIGILVIYIMTGFLVVVTAILAFGVLPRFAGVDNGTQATQWGSLALLLVAVVAGIYALLATKIYWGNKWIVTSDSITQVTQTALFTRQSSQLAMHSIEDVVAEQNGILTQLFRYGVLKVETAGRREKFVFIYCPNPNFYAREILKAREAIMQGVHGRDQASQDYQAPTSQWPPSGTPPPPPNPPVPPPPGPGFNSNV